MNRKVMWGLLSVAALATAGITLPDYTGGTRLGTLGEIGNIWGNPGTQFGLLDGGGQIAAAPDSSFCVIKDNRGVRTRSYQFWWEKGGVRDSLIVAATDTLDLYVQPGEALRLTAQDGGWPLVSGPVTFEVKSTGGQIECRVLNRSVTHFPPYIMQTRWQAEPQSSVGWDVLAQENEAWIGLPADEEFVFVIRAVDPRYDFLLRGASPPIRVHTYEPPPTIPVREGPRLDPSETGWQSSWSLKFAFTDPGSIYLPSVEAGDYKLVMPDGTVMSPTGTPVFRNDSYFTVYCDGCAVAGEWQMVLFEGAVADTMGVFNSLPDTVRFAY